MTRPINPRDISDNELVNRIESKIVEKIQEQPKLQKRVNSLAGLAAGILWVANAGLYLAGITNPAFLIVFGVLISLAEIVTHATTKGPVTKSGEEKVLQAVHEATAEPKPSRPFSTYVDDRKVE